MAQSHQSTRKRHSTLSNHRLDAGHHEPYKPTPEQPKAYTKLPYQKDTPKRRSVAACLAALEPFTGHSIRAYRVTIDTPVRTTYYVVTSYNEEIARWTFPTKDYDCARADIRESLSYVGQITRTHLGLVRAYLGRDVDPDLAPTPY